MCGIRNNLWHQLHKFLVAWGVRFRHNAVVNPMLCSRLLTNIVIDVTAIVVCVGLVKRDLDAQVSGSGGHINDSRV